jgi:NAD(P)-dependent dehydrogenase (short-subunit alcohol dehydrogenase family)
MVEGKRIVVLGGSAGIGLAVARRVAHEKAAEVIIASSNAERVERALGELRGVSPRVSGHAVDLRSEPAVRALFDTIGVIDHLVYTAGEELLVTPLADLDLDEGRAFFEVRYWGALSAIKAAHPHLAKDGSIVLTSGTAVHRPFAGFAVAASVLGAMEAVTRTLAVELAPIRVNIVTPGVLDTELWRTLPAAAKEEMFKGFAAKLPVGRVGTADDVAEHYLGFMRGTYVTGQSLIADGGGVLV